jgi:F1F0 ATPase subunit 2
MIMMNLSEVFAPALAFSGGLVLGAAFHLGLWWTVVRGVANKRSALWFPASLLLRMGGTIAGFYVIGSGHWERFAACLVGFLLAQILATVFAPHAITLSRAGRSIDHAS